MSAPPFDVRLTWASWALEPSNQPETINPPDEFTSTPVMFSLPLPVIESRFIHPPLEFRWFTMNPSYPPPLFTE